MNISIGVGHNLSSSQSTSQKLTPQMQQAIKLLQLSSYELEQEVQLKLDNNPLLERVEEEPVNADDFISLDALSQPESVNEHENEAYHSDYDDVDGFDDVSQAQLDTSDKNNYEQHDTSYDNFSVDGVSQLPSTNESEQVASSDRLEGNNLGELSVDANWSDIYTQEPVKSKTSNQLSSQRNHDNQDLDSYTGATSINLQDHIRWQLNFKHLSEIDTFIAEYLVDSMDDYGFIQIDLDDMEQDFATLGSFYKWEDEVDKEQIEMVLHIIQSCEPLGVGARNLAECLQIQLRKLPNTTEYREEAIALLEYHEQLASNNIKLLMQRTGLQKDVLHECITLIRTLNPSPGITFTSLQPNYSQQPESYDIPDVLVKAVHTNKDTSEQDNPTDNDEKKDDVVAWQVVLNPDTLPKLRINNDYAKLVKRGDDSTDNVYLRNNLLDARLFIRSIEERNQNLLKVATSIVKHQQAFLLHGPTAMQPLILREVADEVGLHESTVSRVTTSKNILTPQGLFSLKYFFSSHVASANGNVSSTAISAKVKDLIANENPKKPLSDSAIKSHLEDEGISIARRTVAKYREAMNIGSSTQRKVKF